jgi:hypothetical protein
MAKTSSPPNQEILLAALQGLEAQRQKLDEQIAQVRGMLGQRVGRPPKNKEESSSSGQTETRTRRTLSSEARKRIAAAQKKRWANYRKSQG